MEGSVCQPHTGDFEALGFLFDSSIDSLLDARPPEVVNENRSLPSGRQFQSGASDDQGWEWPKKAQHVDKVVRLREEVRLGHGGFTPLAVRLVRRQTTRPVLRAAGGVSSGVFFVLAAPSGRGARTHVRLSRASHPCLCVSCLTIRSFFQGKSDLLVFPQHPRLALMCGFQTRPARTPRPSGALSFL